MKEILEKKILDPLRTKGVVWMKWEAMYFTPGQVKTNIISRNFEMFFFISNAFQCAVWVKWFFIHFSWSSTEEIKAWNAGVGRHAESSYLGHALNTLKKENKTECNIHMNVALTSAIEVI